METNEETKEPITETTQEIEVIPKVLEEVKETLPVGRPTKYSQELADRICNE
jgi:hypothetical protein